MILRDCLPRIGALASKSTRPPKDRLEHVRLRLSSRFTRCASLVGRASLSCHGTALPRPCARARFRQRCRAAPRPARKRRTQSAAQVPRPRQGVACMLPHHTAGMETDD
eukprot:6206740-Pleurochrysis_carterae.AAC.2